MMEYYDRGLYDTFYTYSNRPKVCGPYQREEERSGILHHKTFRREGEDTKSDRRSATNYMAVRTKATGKANHCQNRSIDWYAYYTLGGPVSIQTREWPRLKRPGATGVGFQYSGSPSLMDESQRVAMANLMSDSFSVSVELAESLETANYLASRASDLGAVLRSVKRGRWVSRARRAFKRLRIRPPKFTLKTPAERWLETQYAIMPIVLSVEDVLSREGEFLCSAKRFAVKGGAFTESRTRRRILNSSRTGGADLGLYEKELCVTKLYCEVFDPDLRARALLGLALENAPSVAWELVTLSFVVDWAFTVGDFLEQLAATAGLRFIDGYTSSRYELRTEGQFPVGHGGYAYLECDAYERRVIRDFPYHLPHFQSPYSKTHLATAAALIRVRM